MNEVEKDNLPTRINIMEEAKKDIEKLSEHNKFLFNTFLERYKKGMAQPEEIETFLYYYKNDTLKDKLGSDIRRVEMLQIEAFNDSPKRMLAVDSIKLIKEILIKYIKPQIIKRNFTQDHLQSECKKEGYRLANNSSNTFPIWLITPQSNDYCYDLYLTNLQPDIEKYHLSYGLNIFSVPSTLETLTKIISDIFSTENQAYLQISKPNVKLETIVEEMNKILKINNYEVIGENGDYFVIDNRKDISIEPNDIIKTFKTLKKDIQKAETEFKKGEYKNSMTSTYTFLETTCKIILGKEFKKGKFKDNIKDIQTKFLLKDSSIKISELVSEIANSTARERHNRSASHTENDPSPLQTHEMKFALESSIALSNFLIGAMEEKLKLQK